jgi:hypothetical protein
MLPAEGRTGPTAAECAADDDDDDDDARRELSEKDSGSGGAVGRPKNELSECSWS